MSFKHPWISPKNTIIREDNRLKEWSEPPDLDNAFIATYILKYSLNEDENNDRVLRYTVIIKMMEEGYEKLLTELKSGRFWYTFSEKLPFDYNIFRQAIRDAQKEENKFKEKILGCYQNLIHRKKK